MQSGVHTVGDGMRRHLVTLERDRDNLEQAIRLCSQLTDRQERLSDLDAGTLLTEMETLEQSGTTFQNKQRQDVRIRYVAPVAISAVAVVLLAGLIWLMLWAFLAAPVEAPPLPLAVVFMAVPLLLIAGVLLALFQRIKEIEKGEVDDARNY